MAYLHPVPLSAQFSFFEIETFFIYMDSIMHSIKFTSGWIDKTETELQTLEFVLVC